MKKFRIDRKCYALAEDGAEAELDAENTKIRWVCDLYRTPKGFNPSRIACRDAMRIMNEGI